MIDLLDREIEFVAVPFGAAAELAAAVSQHAQELDADIADLSDELQQSNFCTNDLLFCRHSHTKTKSPQTNGIYERFHQTAFNEFYRVAFRKKVYRSTDELQADLDTWIKEYNEARSHQGRWCFGKTPMQTFLDAMPMTKEKMIAA